MTVIVLISIAVLVGGIIYFIATRGLASKTNYISPNTSQPLNTLRNVKAGQTGAVMPISKSALRKYLPEFMQRRDTIYSGLGKEARWHGVLPKMVNDYVRPRYVYEDSTESEELTTKHGVIVGYRISPTLVIHSTVGAHYFLSEINEFLYEFGGKLLEKEDIITLRKNFKKVSEMRELAGDVKLPNGYFWAKPLGSVIEAVHPILPDQDCETAKIANIILKR